MMNLPETGDMPPVAAKLLHSRKPIKPL